MSTPDNTRNRRAAEQALIREPSVEVGAAPVSLLLWLPAVLISALFNGGVILILWLLAAPAQANTAPPLESAGKGEAVVQPEPDQAPPESKDPLKTEDIDEAATDPDIDINYFLDRKEPVSVPGVVNPDEPVGILNGDKTAAPMNLPAPLGLGKGQGGAIEGPFPGTASPVGMPGGYSLRGMPLAGTFYGRSGATREKALREGGGTTETEAAVARGLKWIVRQQATDGHWDLQGKFLERTKDGKVKEMGNENDIAGTAFGLLPLLGAGYTHKKAKGKEDNPYDKPIEKGLMFLIRKQDKKTGNFGGGMYAHALATIAMCEAYGMSQDHAFLRRPAQMAVNYLVKSQHDLGGWRYGPNQAGDMSVTGWVVMALKSAQMANLDVPETTMKKAILFVDSCCDKDNTEGYGYTRSDGVTYIRSSIGLLCRQYLQNWGSQNLRMIKGVERNLETAPPGSRKNMYYYYYATQVLHHFGGDSWKKWNERMRRVLLDTQEKGSAGGKDTNGSWSPIDDAHGQAGGRLMITSLSIMTLEVYYRHLPLYYRDMGEKRLSN
jgi:hypothetical protein